MTIQNIISTINKELISAFALLDRTFDEKKEFLHFCSGGKSVLQLLDHVTTINHGLLLMISEGASAARSNAETIKVTDNRSEYELCSSMLEEMDLTTHWTKPAEYTTENESLHQLRFRLRYQLGECFDHLDLLKNGEGMLHEIEVNEAIGKLDVYHCIYFIALHTRRQARQIEKLFAEFEDAVH